MTRLAISDSPYQQELVTAVVDGVLTPEQTCFVCSRWGSGCPDMLAISRAIATQSLDRMRRVA
jgi:hypothetical protein